ncbi:MAG: phage tail protein [Dehalococcoidia bacterium]|nr:phage tail protein [Dehalococcoidia bacterium]
MSEIEVSTYLQYLPSIYRDSPFMGRFLRIFESVLEPIRRLIDNGYYYFDPLVTPEELLTWLAGWVDVTLDDSWTLNQRREVVRRAAELYRWRGTRRGLREHLQIYAGILPIIEDGSVPHSFTVTLMVRQPAAISESSVRTIIESHRPAHTTYRLIIGRAE